MTKSITSQLSDNAIYQILEIIASEIDDFEPHYIIDCLLSFASTQSKENLLNEILVDYFSLIDDDRLSELEDIIVNQFGES